MKHNKCIVAPHFEENSALAQVADLSNIISKISTKTFLITEKDFRGNIEENVELVPVNIKYMEEKNIFLQLIKFLMFNLKVMGNIFIIRKDFKTAIFYNSNYILVILFAKLLRKRTIIVVLGDLKHCGYIWYHEKFFGLGGYLARFLFGVLRKISFIMVDDIVVEYEDQITDLAKEYNFKAKVAPIRYINHDLFYYRTPYNDRPLIIGYVGRLHQEKGILNLINAIPGILTNYNNIKFILIGGGPLENEIKETLINLSIEKNVDLVGWISHNDIPLWLDKMKLIIVPSYTEGLPGVILEAMACGVPVLANRVGGIEYIINDAENGFLMENNHPVTISRNVVRALKLCNDKLIFNAMDTIKTQYVEEIIIEKWKKVIN